MHCLAVVWVSRPRAFTWFGREHLSRMSQETQQSLELTSVHTASKATKHAHALQNAVQASRRLLAGPCCPPTGQGRARRVWRSRTECPIHGSGCSSPRVGVCLCITFLPFLHDYICFFPSALCVQESFCKTPDSLWWASHHARCICGVFLGTGELQGDVLLLPHLSWSPSLSLWWCNWSLINCWLFWESTFCFIDALWHSKNLLYSYLL